ncbi:MAG: DUF3846 domain-containing protein [Flavonifractor plautii]
MKADAIQVLKVASGKAPEAITIPNTLEAMQQMVGGYIEVIPLEDVCLVCNEEGKLMGPPGSPQAGGRHHCRYILPGREHPGRRLLLPYAGADRPLGPAFCPAGVLPAR